MSRLNISLDTLDPDKYTHITRRGKLQDALRGIESALDAGFKKVKINSVLIGGFNEDEIPALAGMTQKYPVDIRFIELMPMVDSEEFGPEAYVPGSAVLECLPEAEPVPADGGVAALYRLPGVGYRPSARGSLFAQAATVYALTSDGAQTVSHSRSTPSKVWTLTVSYR